MATQQQGVSILMPVKNATPFLQRCLQSIVIQQVRWELIVVDDHSTDDSSEILTAWATKHTNIRLLKNNGHGIIDALKTAYAHSNHAFVTRMDADDAMPADKLQILLNTWRAHSSKDPVVVGKVKYMAEEALGGGYKRYEKWINQNLDGEQPMVRIYQECVVPSCAWLMSSNRFDQLTAQGTWKYPEDYDLCFNIYLQLVPLVVADKVVHHWYDHKHRTSRTSEVYRDQDFFELKLDYFLQKDVDTTKKCMLWGAGPRGKKLAKIMIDRGLEFDWVTDNDKKIGHIIYDQLIKPVPETLNWKACQVLVAISGPSDQQEVVSKLKDKKGVEGEDYFLFVN